MAREAWIVNRETVKKSLPRMGQAHMLEIYFRRNEPSGTQEA